MDVPSGAKWNAATSEPTNLYHPRFVVGIGDDKAGVCPVCIEPEERGGEGVQKWLKVSDISSTDREGIPDPWTVVEEQRLLVPYELCAWRLERLWIALLSSYYDSRWFVVPLPLKSTDD